MDARPPERTDTSSGLAPSPKVLPVMRPTWASAARTCSCRVFGAALPAGRLLIDLIRRDVDLTMEFTDSVAPGPNDHGRRCRRKPGNLRAAKGFPVTG